MTKEERIRLRVSVVNLVNEEANDMAVRLQEMLKSFVGKKVHKVDGSLTAAFSAELEKIKPKANNLMAYNSPGRYNLVIVVKGWIDHPHGCEYHEQSIFVGPVNNGVLIQLNHIDPVRCNFTYEEICEKINRHKKLSEEIYQNKRGYNSFSNFFDRVD